MRIEAAVHVLQPPHLAVLVAFTLPGTEITSEFSARTEPGLLDLLVALARARDEQIDGIAFGDLYLEDIRRYRVRQLEGTGIEPLFPIWGTSQDTPALARRMIERGLRAVLSCVDPKQLDPAFAGRAFDDALLADLPRGVDPCGENGEFHTFAWDGPMFRAPVHTRSGPLVERDGFVYADLLADVA